MSEPTPSRPSGQRFVASLVALVVLMTGFGFALVPMYNAFCQLTGLNGRGTEAAAAAYAGSVDAGRTVLEQFLVSTVSGLPFDFQPAQREMQVHPGAVYAASARAANRSGARIEVQAVESYVPGRATRYLHRAEYFCNTREGFAPREHRDMPVRFYLDPALPADMNVVTLAYTYYNVTPDGVTAAGRRLD